MIYTYSDLYIYTHKYIATVFKTLKVYKRGIIKKVVFGVYKYKILSLFAGENTQKMVPVCV